jgi:DNA polymerase-3 subunit beta
VKIACARDDLAHAVARAARGLSKRSDIHILSGIRAEAAGDHLELCATDLELSVSARTPAAVAAEGAVVIPGRTLDAIVRLLPEPTVEIEHVAGAPTLRISSGSSSYDLNAYDIDDFPRLPQPEGTMFGIEREPFLAAVRQVARAASRDESRPVYTGILTRLEPGTVVMAASDGYRLAVKETPLRNEGAAVEALVPARGLQELLRLATSGDEITLGIGERHVVFDLEQTRLTSRRLDGVFQDYEALIGTPFPREVAVARDELLDAVQRTAVLVERRLPIIQLRFAEGELTVRVQARDLGEARETLAIHYDDAPLDIAFNAQFLRDGLESVTGRQVRFKLRDPLRPIVLQGDGDDFSYLIAPIRRPAQPA